MMADPSIRLLVLDELNIALRYDYLPLAEVVAALVRAPPRPACRRHRPQRQAGADRGGRLRHRVRARQASFRRRRARAGGDRVLTARALMFQGTGSDVGKSLIVAGLCRAVRERGLRVRPFKPQNMSNNAAVTDDGGEIGRAQALQARACGVSPSVHMNPVLLKPQSEIGAQVVVQGRVIGNAKAREYQALKPKLMAAVLDSYARMKADADLVLVEGAGSAAEINLREGDIANMGFARAAGLPGRADRRHRPRRHLRPNSRRRRPRSRRGRRDDRRLHRQQVPRRREPVRGAAWRRSPSAPAGAPSASCRSLPKPRACRRRTRSASATGSARTDGAVTIAVPMLARIANFDDFDPLRIEPAVRLVFVRPGEPLPVADLVILPGSKATIADLTFFREQGWDIDLLAHARRGGRVLGVCGGYQMLGRRVADPRGHRGAAGRGRGPRPARRRDRADRREDAARGRRRVPR